MTSNKQGFTLIELLAVAAVVGVLLSIMVPIVSGVRSNAVQAACASNLRHIGIALHTYALDHDDQLPHIAHGRPANESWIFTLAPYLDDMNAVRVSPADPLFEEKIQHSSATTYVMNDMIFLQRMDPFGRPLGEIPRLGVHRSNPRAILAFTGRERTTAAGFSATNDHTHATQWNAWARVIRDISPNLHRRGESNADQTNGKSHYLFADGRVATFSAQKMKNLIDSGINFADPESIW